MADNPGHGIQQVLLQVTLPFQIITNSPFETKQFRVLHCLCLPRPVHNIKPHHDNLLATSDPALTSAGTSMAW
jgi:hypothetical protein